MGSRDVALYDPAATIAGRPLNIVAILIPLGPCGQGSTNTGLNQDLKPNAESSSLSVSRITDRRIDLSGRLNPGQDTDRHRAKMGR
jgi:hypothetical protein